MTREDIKTATTQFGQAQSAYARDHSGTGLGIPLVYKFMELLGGKVDIKSIKAEGTTVYLDFPLMKK
jgi:signal transduction histidine kinase